MVTVVRNTDWAVVWNSAQGHHEYARSVDIAFDATGILFVGKSYEGPFAQELDGSERLALPGMVNIHTDPTGAAPLKWSTHWDSIYPIEGGSEYGRQAR